MRAANLRMRMRRHESGIPRTLRGQRFVESENFTAWNAGLRQTVEQATALSSSDLAIDFGHQHRPIRGAADIGRSSRT